jgi:type I restriction enzyme, S subunit
MKSTETESTDNRPTIFANRSIPLDQATESSCLRQIQGLQTEIGVYPVDWIVDRIDSAFDIQQGKQVSKRNRDGEHQRPFLRTKNVFWNRLELTDLDQMHFSEAEQSRLELRANDLLVCEGGSIGRTALWNEEVEGCLYQNHLHRLRAKDNKADSQFGVYWLWYAFDVAKLYIGRGNVTTIPNLSQSKLAELPMAFPSLPEQKKIAHILSTVQRAIEAQERIIQTTTELKKALMHKLFTEGLRNEPQKETEIGLVPESWATPYLGEVSKIRYGLGQPPQQADDGVPMIRATNIKRGQISKHGLIRIKRSAIPETRNPYLQVGDVVVVRSGAYTGDVAMITEEWAGSVAGYDLVVSPGTSLNSAFCADALLSTPVQQYFKGQSNRAAQAHLNRQQLQTTRIPLPPRKEQDDIAGILNTTQKKIDYAEQRCVAFKDLFRTLLHEIMTAKSRVNHLNITVE